MSHDDFMLQFFNPPLQGSSGTMCRVFNAASMSMELLPALFYNIQWRRISLLPNIYEFRLHSNNLCVHTTIIVGWSSQAQLAAPL